MLAKELDLDAIVGERGTITLNYYDFITLPDKTWFETPKLPSFWELIRAISERNGIQTYARSTIVCPRRTTVKHSCDCLDHMRIMGAYTAAMRMVSSGGTPGQRELKPTPPIPEQPFACHLLKSSDYLRTSVRCLKRHGEEPRAATAKQRFNMVMTLRTGCWRRPNA